ncbi:hypothetical protein OG866_27195 [Streptomyces sp. NBC_00663]|uniref:hypothetical protein n=1 Tax=Streptomyces sp. NBC_00663 TaxID=2975801 RepID=UPI002E36BE7E|nr:hypothetical protein [Streptomyces sp. NBC_00663]
MKRTHTEVSAGTRLLPDGAGLVPSPTVVVATSDRQQATEQWLLSTHPTPDVPRQEWTDHGVALLPLGTLFSAVRIPAHLVLALTGGEEMPSPRLDVFLDEALGGGPVICDPQGRRFYALVPASMPAKWHRALQVLSAMGVDLLGRNSYLGVPKVDAVELNPVAWKSYWSVPMPSMAMLCEPYAVVQLIAAGQDRIEGDPQA